MRGSSQARDGGSQASPCRDRTGLSKKCGPETVYKHKLSRRGAHANQSNRSRVAACPSGRPSKSKRASARFYANVSKSMSRSTCLNSVPGLCRAWTRDTIHCSADYAGKFSGRFLSNFRFNSRCTPLSSGTLPTSKKRLKVKPLLLLFKHSGECTGYRKFLARPPLLSLPQALTADSGQMCCQRGRSSGGRRLAGLLLVNHGSR